MQDDTTAGRGETAKLWSLIRQVGIAMLSTVEPDGSLRSRPMYTCNTEEGFDGALWFVTDRSDPKAFEVSHAPEVGVVYACTRDNVYVALSGRANLIDDRTRLERLWRDELAKWFPKGKDDPNLALIRVDVFEGEYWDEPSSAASAAWKAVKTGLGSNDTGHAKVTL
ncbi:pyridoxamine 5'-phosphate oxidase family protein [Marinivivus vitaminiproducens]|uniref:pyridoxamine 5'-phosphate oxidase family protein n=1 Tax=Marinivivus vitaminiproducens TaxID=3035935 RepID=UPI00279A6BDF|nr:pyridoxamine 5'-phosphate oxidase family protein [Geminicoccaceae bacterium SCSIO 64248]